MFNRSLALFLSLAPLFCSVRFAQAAPQPQNAPAAAAAEIVPTRYLVIPPVGRSGRTATHTDAIEAQIVAGKWTPPQAGDTVTLLGGATRKWEAATTDKNGTVSNSALEGGYAYLAVDAPNAGVYLLEAGGHSMVYVNGVPHTGDPYDFGYTRLPVMLRAGRNDLLFSCGRGHLRARLIAPRGLQTLDASDATLPDLILGQPVRTYGAMVAINAADAPQGDLFLAAALKNGSATVTPLPPLTPLATRKVAFELRGRAQTQPGDCPVELRLLRRSHGHTETLDTITIKLRVRKPTETYKRTFFSDIDGSLQYYAVNPAVPLSPHDPPPALVLTLHGASVEAIGQADAYEHKSWANLVAPTNRRPYGFDWEDWGRMDALEALADARKHLTVDPQRIYLAGHSMGGHGTWQIGVTYPNLFAAIGPSAGWISFASYVGRGQRQETPSPLAALLARAATPSDTLALKQNYAQEGVYILHGSADDNVPVTEARTMSKELSAFHHDYVYFEQPGAGHWWDVSDEPGADCVDWAPMYDFFAHHALPAELSVRQVDFATANPGVSTRDHWAGIEAQIHPLQVSAVHLRCDPGLRRFVGTTENVATLSLALDGLPAGAPLRLDLDGQKLDNVSWPAGKPTLWLARRGDRWELCAPPAIGDKRPERDGPYKEAFRHRMLFVYGTQGAPEENAQLYAKARYDAETFWYRGNGSVDLVADRDFNPNREPDRGVILYGNADTNSAWKPLLSDSPVQVRRGLVQVGEHQEHGDDLACLFLRPRPGSATACVAAVAGSGPAGMRLTERLPYFVSGVAYPDWTVIGPEMLTNGVAGIRGAGFFANDWSLNGGDAAWR
jgi:dienelactone hydrolase